MNERGKAMAYLGEEIKKLGFGMMRLPKKDGKIDIETTKQMVDLFMDAGFSYFDTAWSYDGSEEAVGEALVKRYPRKSYQLATKNAAWIRCKTKEDAWAQLDQSLARTGAGYFDFYLLHNMGQERTKYFEKFDMWNFIREKKAEGKIRHIGFSCHTTPEEMDKILFEHPEVEFVQLQINYADWDDPKVQSRACYEMARKYGKPVIVMEPVKGGMLANPPEPVKKIFREADSNASFASWAIRYAASLDGLVTVLSGMSSIEQLKDNLSYMKSFSGMTKKESAVIEKAQAALHEIPLIPCTACNYCAKVCPNDIAVSASFSAMNIATLYGKEAALGELNFQLNDSGKKTPDRCAQCGLCEEACPQHIAIREELKKAAAALL